MILQEILRSDADIVCMEEVDHFDDYLLPQLEEKGFGGLFVEKRNSPCLEFTPNNGPDGCALFYRSSKLQLIKKKEIVLDRQDGSKSNQVAMVVQLKFVDDSAVGEETDQTDAKTEDVEKSGSGPTSQDTNDLEKTVEGKLDKQQPPSSNVAPDSRTVCIAVTHLKAKREAVELRAAQGKHLLSEVTSFVENQPVIVCGDFNATTDEPVYEYFSGGKSPLKLASSYVSRYYGDKEPPLTSWKYREAGESKYTIDYIWFTPESLLVDSIWAVPTEDEIGKNGLPSISYPSDHVSICTCFRL